MAVTADKNELCTWRQGHQRRRLSGSMMCRRNGVESGHSLVEAAQVFRYCNSWRGRQSVAGYGDGGTKNQLGRTGPKVSFNCAPEAKEHPGQLVVPVGAGQPGLQSLLEASVHSFDQTITLRVVSGGCRKFYAQRGGHMRPELRSKLTASVGGDYPGQTKPGHPGVEQGRAQRGGRSVLYWHCFRPSRKSVHNGK